MSTLKPDHAEVTLRVLRDALAENQKKQDELRAEGESLRAAMRAIERDQIAASPNGQPQRTRRKRGEIPRLVTELLRSQAGSPLTQTQIAEKLGLPKSSVGAVLTRKGGKFQRQGLDGWIIADQDNLE